LKNNIQINRPVQELNRSIDFLSETCSMTKGMNFSLSVSTSTAQNKRLPLLTAFSFLQ